MKFGPSGNLLWTLGIIGSGLALDSNGNIYVALNQNSFQFEELNSSGVSISSSNISNPSSWSTSGIAIDSSNNVYLLGNMYVAPNVLNRITKINSAGGTAWDTTVAGSILRYLSFAVDSGGNVYATGVTTVIGVNNYILTTKFNSAGATVLNDMEDVGIGGQVVVDGNQNIYVAGSGGNVLKYNSSFQLVNDIPITAFPSVAWGGIALDSNSDIYLNGVILSSGSPMGSLLVRYDPTWDLQWEITNSNDQGGGPVAVDAQGNIIAETSVENNLAWFTNTRKFSSSCQPTATPTPCNNNVIYTDSLTTTGDISNYYIYATNGSLDGQYANHLHVNSGGLVDTAVSPSTDDLILANNLTPPSNFTVQANVEQSAATGIIGIVFREQDSSHFYVFQFNNATAGSNFFQVLKYSGGTVTTLSASLATMFSQDSPVGTPVLMKVICNGSNFQCYINTNNGNGDVMVCDVADSAYSTGGVGLRSAGLTGSATNTFTNLQVSSCVAFTPTPTATALATAQATAGTSGVTVALNDGTSAEIGAGVLAQGTTVTIDEYPPSLAPQTGSFQVLEGNIYTFSAVGPGGSVSNFGSNTVTLVFPYTQSQLPQGYNANQLQVNYYNGTNWNTVSGIVDTVHDTVTVAVNHFSIWGILLNLYTPTSTPTNTGTFTATLTPTSSATLTPTFTPSSTTSSTATASLTNTTTLMPTQTSTNTLTDTETSTLTNTLTSTSTVTATFSPTSTTTNTSTPTLTYTYTSTPTASSTFTPTFTTTNTPANTFTQTQTSTPTNSLTSTLTSTRTFAPTVTPTSTKTGSPTSTATKTPTATITETPTRTFTSTITPTPAKTSTPTKTATKTPSSTSTKTPTSTATFSPTNTPGGAATPTPANDAYAQWTESTNNPNFGQRTNYGAVSFGGDMWVIGGYNYNFSAEAFQDVNDVWSSINGSSWSQTTTTKVFPARDSMGIVAFNNQMWVIGGENQATPQAYNDVWSSSNGVSWSEAVTTAPWSARYGSGCLVYNGQIWIIGGYNSQGQALKDVWTSTNGTSWTQETSSVAFGIRAYPGCAVLNGSMWVMGGEDGFGDTFNDVWNSTDGINWNKVSPAALWKARTQMACLAYNGQLVVSAGWAQNNASFSYYNDVYHSPDGVNWTASTYSTGFGIRAGITDIVYNNQLWMFDGWNNNQTYNEVWFAPPTPLPTLTSTPTPPGGRARPLGGVSGEANPTATPTATVTSTPSPLSRPGGLQVAAVPNFSTGGEPVRFLVNLDHPGLFRVNLFSLSGEQVYSNQIEGSQGLNTLLWNLQNNNGLAVASGLYVYVLQIGEGSAQEIRTGKVVILH